MQLISVNAGMFKVKAPRIRCVRCAEGMPPPDLPALIAKQPIEPFPFTRMGAVKPLVDFKMVAAGISREPGEDDE